MFELKRGSVVRAVVVMAAVAAVGAGAAQSAVYWANYGSNASGTTIGRANLEAASQARCSSARRRPGRGCCRWEVPLLVEHG